MTPGYPTQPPELVFEVLSPSDRYRELQEKAIEYLSAGVRCVVIADPSSETVVLYHPEHPPQTLGKSDAFEVAELLPGFSVSLPRFFEDAK